MIYFICSHQTHTMPALPSPMRASTICARSSGPQGDHCPRMFTVQQGACVPQLRGHCWACEGCPRRAGGSWLLLSLSPCPEMLHLVTMPNSQRFSRQGLGNAFLSNIKACDGIFHCTRTISHLSLPWSPSPMSPVPVHADNRGV